jgi:diaminopimelate decarboxylase
MIKINAIKTPLIADLLTERQILFQIATQHEGPTHIVFPQQIRENIEAFKNILYNLELDFKIHLAHKPTKSKALVREAFKAGIGIDVASVNELQGALEAGFKGTQIVCTGPKTRQFLKIAVKHGCLISLDSLMEMHMLTEIAETETFILLRIADPECRDRNYTGIESRFGIPKRTLNNAYALFKHNKNLILQGFHYHNNVRIPEVKAGFLDDLIDLMQQAYMEGFSPTIINIGGDFRQPALADYKEWETFLDHIEQGLISNTDIEVWRNYSYGMYLNARNRVSQRDKLQGMFTATTNQDVISTMLLDESFQGRPLAEILAENMWTLMTEPGWILLQHCGISLLPVIGVKETASGHKLVIVNANHTNFSTFMRDWFTDPILIFRKENNSDFSGFIVGNLCEEQDFIVKRLIHFDQKPEEGDLLCFINTAAYTVDFEEASPMQQSIGVKFSAVKKKTWEIEKE